jgi:hypothetical protein
MKNKHPLIYLLLAILLGLAPMLSHAQVKRDSIPPDKRFYQMGKLNENQMVLVYQYLQLGGQGQTKREDLTVAQYGRNQLFIDSLMQSMGMEFQKWHPPVYQPKDSTKRK